VLTELAIVLNGRTYPLRPGIRCEIDATGDVQRYATSRATLTRMAAEGMLLGKSGVAAGAAARKTSVHTVDSRQLYLIVTGPDWQEVVRIDPNYGPGARRFAAQMFSASQQAQALAEEHRRRWVTRSKHERRRWPTRTDFRSPTVLDGCSNMIRSIS
jgi:hypothetical protein